MKFFKLFVLAVLIFTSSSVQAARTNPKFASLVIDAKTGATLQNSYGDEIRHPASITKLMTLYLTFEALENGKLRMNQSVYVSAHAAAQPRTNLALKAGNSIVVKDIVSGLVVVSANDAASVIAEKLGKTESNFGVMMTQKARQLGMNSTVFKNASGLPHPRQVSTARDIAKLLLAVKRDFPQYYHLLSQRSFKFRGVNYASHNRFGLNYKGAKAGKTGFINASGFNLVTNVEKNGRDIVAVILGGRTAYTRDAAMVKLVDGTLNQGSSSVMYANNNSAKPAVRTNINRVATAKARPVYNVAASRKATPTKVATANTNQPASLERNYIAVSPFRKLASNKY